MNFIKNPKIILFILALILAIFNVFLYRVTTSYVENLVFSRLTLASEDVEQRIKERMIGYVKDVNIAKAFFQSDERIRKDEWLTYVANTKILESSLGLRRLSYSPVVNHESLGELMVQAEQEGLKSFKIFPDKVSSVYIPYFYLAPEDDKMEQVIGFNLYSDNKRKAALDYAIDNNSVAITDLVVLVSELKSTDRRKAISIYAPIYKKGADITTPVNRRQNISGFVTATVLLDEFLEGLTLKTVPGLQFQVFDNSLNGILSENNLLFDASAGESIQPGKIAQYSLVSHIQLPNTIWNIRFLTVPEQNFRRLFSSIPNLVLLSSVLLSVVILYVIKKFLGMRQSYSVKETVYVNRLIAEDAAVDSLETSTIVVNLKGLIIVFNKKAEQILGYKEYSVVDKKNILDIVSQDTVNAHCELLSKELKSKVDPDFNVLVTRCLIDGSDKQEWEFIGAGDKQVIRKVRSSPLYSVHTKELLGYQLELLA